LSPLGQCRAGCRLRPRAGRRGSCFASLLTEPLGAEISVGASAEAEPQSASATRGMHAWVGDRICEDWSMGQAVGQVLPLGVAAALSPFPIIGVVLMLTARRATVNGLSFLLGWLVGCAALGAVVLVVADSGNASSATGPALWTGIARIVLGVLSLLVSVKYWRGRPRGEQEAELPSWMSAIDRFGAARAAGTGVLLSAANPKNALLIVGARSRSLRPTSRPVSGSSPWRSLW
jgi:hypothetical protein